MIDNNRIKTAMIVYSLEKAVGDFVKNHTFHQQDLPEKVIEGVEERNSDLIDGDTTISNLVERTYINEIFSMAQSCAKGTNYEALIKDLREFCKRLELYDIRNAISHPNRPFHDCYWFRAAAVATDPLIDKLGFTSVKAAFTSANKGTLTEPPSEWMSKQLFEIPNNLPHSFEHEITGLIGRSKDLKEIKKIILNPRHNTMAITAPGGVGKTAITLQIMKDISVEPSSYKNIEGIVFISMKTERLTINGIQELTSAETLEQLNEEILISLSEIFNIDLYDNLEDAFNHLADKKIVLFIDNLETLIRDHSNDFERLLEQFPPRWKVLVTTRIPLNAGISHPLPEMGHSDAKILARNYASRRGVNHLTDIQYEKIAKTFSGNPLAVRLSIDAIQSGKNIEDIFKDVPQDLAHFSYKNLIEVLDESAIYVLEALFIQDKISREDISDLCDMSLDEAVSAIMKLKKTSLVFPVMEDDVELYSINSGIRHLLAINEKNLEIRTKILEKNSKEKAKAFTSQSGGNQKTISKHSFWYIPEDVPSSLKSLIIENNSYIRKSDVDEHKRSELYHKFNEKEEIYSNCPSFWIARSLFSQEIKDLEKAKYFARVAEQKGGSSFTANHQLSSICFYDESNYADSEQYLEKVLFNSQYTTEIVGYHEFHKAWKLYLKSLLCQNKYDEILAKTNLWNNSGKLVNILGGFRITALLRKSEWLVTQKDFSLIGEAVNIANEMASLSVTNKDSFIGLYDTILELFTKKSMPPLELTEKFMKYLYNCIIWLDLTNTQVAKDYKIISTVQCNNNPFNDGSMKPYIDAITHNDFDLPSNIDAYIEVSVYNIPEHETPRYLFAKDNNLKQYFLHFDNCKNVGWYEWLMISNGSKLYIKPDSARKIQSKEAQHCSEIYLLQL